MTAPAAVTTSVAVSIEARALTHRYGRRVALESLNFEVSPGITAVTGSNGSGKSTLLRIVSGLLRPSAGECTVTVGGRKLSNGERRHFVGLATPELSFYEEMSALENLAFAAEARGLADPRASARAALEKIELIRRADDRVGALSSGMRQRLRLGFAALGDPPILLLDEPGSHLDDAGRSTLDRWIADHANRGLMLLATNDEREWRLADRRIELRSRNLGDPA